MEALIGSVTAIFTAAIDWAATVGTMVVQTPILLLFVVLPLVGLGISIFKRLLRI